MRFARLVLDRLAGGLCCVVLAIMIVVVTWQVFSRYVLNDPSTFSEELLRFGVIWLSLIGAAYVTGRNKHMSVDLLKEMLGGNGRKVLNLVIQVGFFIFAVAVLIVGGMHAVNIAGSQYTAVLQVPMGLIYAALPTSGVLMAAYSVLNLVDELTGKPMPEPTIEKNSVMGE
ncbi:TRAP transporter small permease [Consotaella salsifontis]|uniref:TRAP transporter small permease protein n=1 Tax=Consotaella salsifontis TaxID=1365950 RepID=A0A1T4P064_9HYPH|nr:TRAP transporter small permease [Consotaella salsifontis]SJZ84944.1 TRAP-type C4-dicarboxylate transport system, small permease component [Consotaella salsifontis]